MAEDTSPQPANDFATWVTTRQEKYTGHDLLENQPKYIPFSELEIYWTVGRIAAVLRSYDKPLPFDSYSIQSDYLRIFSTLVSTSDTRLLLGLILTNNLDDNQWPLTEYPSKWPQQDGASKKAFKRVTEAQWIFFPLHFRTSRLNNSELNVRRILPIEELETIVQEGDSCIHKIKLRDEYNDLHPAPTGRFLALKDYDLNTSDVRYSNEVDAHNLLRLNASENLVTSYGSFRKDGHGFLILEFADAGDLNAYFTKTAPPKATNDVKLFWTSLLKSLLGLDRIHQLMEVDNNIKNIIQGIHQDIKPANILLFQNPSQSPYDFMPKIADFGLFSQARKTRSNSDEAKGITKHGNQVYSAPEAGINYRHKIRGMSLVTPRADIFSFGAVLSAAAAWVIGGRSLQDEYFEKRRDAHTKLKKFNRTGFEGCFHVGTQEQKLEVIDHMHKKIRDHCRDNEDLVTPQVLDIVEKHMLLPLPSERQQARVLLDYFHELLSNEPLSRALTVGTDPLSLRRRSTVLSSVASDEQSTQTSISSMQRIHTFIEGRGRVLDPEVKNLVDQITLNLRDRDQFFFIDDSTSMKRYRSIVCEGFQAIASIAERLDPNRVELAFASMPKRVHRARKTKALVKLLRNHKYEHDPHMMENSFSELVEHQIIRKLPFKKMGFNINLIARKRVSVYIFTDGNWGDDRDGACRVERPVEELIKEVLHRKLSKNQVTLHFVRFGDSKEGGRHLEFLDHFGEKFDCDIVDVKHISSDVKSLFYGPLTYENDRRDEGVPT